MRMVLNILIVLTAALLLAGVMWQHRVHSEERQRIEQARDDVKHFHRVIALQAALNNIERSSRGYPMVIEPSWFDGELPTNPLLSPTHPWLEIAHPHHAELRHPLTRAANSSTYARFWYNPANGIVRARVPRGASDAATLRLYNKVNDSNLTRLFPDPDKLRAIERARQEAEALEAEAQAEAGDVIGLESGT
jgi:hypothetical protein